MLPIKSMLFEVRPYLKDSWSLGWPMILIMFFHFSIGITDVYVAGYLGTGILAAVGYVGQLYWLLLILGNAITVGTVALVSQAHGAGSPEGVGRISAHSFIVALAISGVLAVTAATYPETVVRIAGMPPEIESYAEAFIQIFSLALVPSYFSIISAGILRASDRVRYAMINSGIAAAINVVGDFALTYGWGPIPALGFQGIAWASAGATTVGMALNMYHICRGPSRIDLRVFISPAGRCLKNLLKLGGPSAGQQVAWNAGVLVVYFLVGRMLQEGEITALAAMTAGLRIEAIIFLPIFALNMASAVLTGNRIGAGDIESARAGAKATSLLSVVITAVPVILIFVLAPNLASLLTDDPAVLAEMTRYLRINMVAMPFLAVGVTLSGALQGAGDTLATMVMVFLGMWVIRIPMILFAIFGLQSDATGVWWALTLSLTAMCGMMAWRFRGDAWTTASVDKKNKSMMWEACAKR
jgi:putative MATE family efflux protein